MVVLGDVVLLGAVFGKVVEFPGDFIGLAFPPDEFPVAFAEAAGFLVLEGEGAGRDGFWVVDGGEEGSAFGGGDLLTVSFGRVFRAGCFEDGGDDVHEVGGGGDEVGIGFDPGGPVDEKGGGDSAFVAEVFIHVEGGVAEVGPAGAVGGVGSGLADGGELVAGVEGGFSEP